MKWPIFARTVQAATSRPAAIALWLVCIGLVLLDIWGLSLFHGTPNYQASGTWGAWASSAASLLAVTVALAGNQMTQARYLADKQEELNREVTEISAWTENSLDGDETCLDLVIRNKTGHPIETWSIFIKSVGVLDSVTLGPITPEDNKFSLEMPTTEITTGSLPCEISFTDRVGRRWKTNTAGGKQLI